MPKNILDHRRQISPDVIRQVFVSVESRFGDVSGD
jgi:hypothetical protein